MSKLLTFLSTCGVGFLILQGAVCSCELSKWHSLRDKLSIVSEYISISIPINSLLKTFPAEAREIAMADFLLYALLALALAWGVCFVVAMVLATAFGASSLLETLLEGTYEYGKILIVDLRKFWSVVLVSVFAALSVEAFLKIDVAIGFIFIGVSAFCGGLMWLFYRK
jgi:hypothetical protein